MLLHNVCAVLAMSLFGLACQTEPTAKTTTAKSSLHMGDHCSNAMECEGSLVCNGGMCSCPVGYITNGGSSCVSSTSYVAKPQVSAPQHYVQATISSDSPVGLEEMRTCELTNFDCSGFANPVTCQNQMVTLCMMTATGMYGGGVIEDHTPVTIIGTTNTAHFHLTGVRLLEGERAGKETWVLSSKVQ